MKNERVKEILKIIDIQQLLDIFLFPIIWLISLVFKPCCKDVWIITENPNEACDNGYIFFKYIRNNRKDINAYYVINKKSKDYKKIESLGNIIQYRSIKHWIYYLNAKKIILTQKYSNPSPALFYVLHTKKILKNQRIFLQHGITKDDAKMFYYNRTNFRLFICGAKKEYEYVKEKFNYPKENVVYTGFARFDNLIENSSERLILIAPTWRKWISNQKEFDDFIKNYYDLLANKKLSKLLEKNNMKLQMILHKNMKKFKINININKINNNIIVKHNDEVDIQQLINNTELLITDYSSIFFDIAYRKKAIIYYQFDKEKYRKNQLPEGYFSYLNDGFGDIIDNIDLLVNKLDFYIKNNFKVEDKYIKRMNNFFERKDKNNCKRILQEIEKI